MVKKFNRRELERKNNAELAKISNWLKQGPRVVLQAAVTRAHSSVMQSEHMGGRMMHDTSNAAYNWRVSIDGSMLGIIDAKGRAPVGDEGDQRTRTGNDTDILKVISARLVEDAGKLDRAVWGSAKIVSVSLINPIGGYYAINANLDEASSGRVWKQYATLAASSAFDSWYNAGPKVNWSRHSKPIFGGG